MAQANNKIVEKLVNEMGFNLSEVKMALSDTSGNVDLAIQKLTSGCYAPPPYSKADMQSTPEGDKKSNIYPNLPQCISKLVGRGKAPNVTAMDASAPPLFDNFNSVSSSDGPDISALNSLPPPYAVIEREGRIKNWELNMNIRHLNSDSINVDEDIRCSVCFNVAGGNQEKIVSQNGKIFHYKCFSRKFGPKCAHCCLPLSQPDKDHELSGKYLVYKEKDYHVECYAKYAGPRCCSCFNVIIEKPNGEFSGHWVVDKHQEYHLECLQKKMYAIWRSKNI